MSRHEGQSNDSSMQSFSEQARWLADTQTKDCRKIVRGIRRLARCWRELVSGPDALQAPRIGSARGQVAARELLDRALKGEETERELTAAVRVRLGELTSGASPYDSVTGFHDYFENLPIVVQRHGFELPAEEDLDPRITVSRAPAEIVYMEQAQIDGQAAAFESQQLPEIETERQALEFTLQLRTAIHSGRIRALRLWQTGDYSAVARMAMQVVRKVGGGIEGSRAGPLNGQQATEYVDACLEVLRDASRAGYWEWLDDVSRQRHEDPLLRHCNSRIARWRELCEEHHGSTRARCILEQLRAELSVRHDVYEEPNGLRSNHLAVARLAHRLASDELPERLPEVEGRVTWANLDEHLAKWLRLLEGAALPGRSKRTGKRMGRPPHGNPEKDAKIAEAWATGQYRTHAELARELDMDAREVKLALDRHRHQLRRKRGS